MIKVIVKKQNLVQELDLTNCTIAQFYQICEHLVDDGYDIQLKRY